ncbi:MAG: glycosyltransferase [Roseobacter sp.]
MGAEKPSILFIHDEYPGQFGAFAEYLMAQGWAVSFATLNKNIPENMPYPVFGYTPHRTPAAQTHPYAQSYDRAVLTGQACARTCMAAKDAGELAPHVILSHVGPGAGLYVRDVFPDAFIVAYCEWWYHSPGVDTCYLMDLAGQIEEQNLDQLIMSRSRNTSICTEILSANKALCPTEFQASQFPKELRRKITVFHDGVDADYFCPLSKSTNLKNPANGALAALPTDAGVVTYATRGMEPHRGFPQVMQAFSKVAAQRADTYFVVAGENKVFYGSDQDRTVDWFAEVTERYPIPRERLICPGTLTKSDYRWLLRRSCAHVYCTVPFVLSWSLLDAMSVGAPLIVSDVAPVREVVPVDVAKFVDLRSPLALSRAIIEVLEEKENAVRKSKLGRNRILADYNIADQLEQRRQWLLDGLSERTRCAP